MVPASPAQFQFSHALGSPARQGFHLRDRRYLGHAGYRHLTCASATPAAKPPSAPARSESQEAPGASSRPQARAGTGLRRRGGAAAPGVRGALAATPSSCAVTAPAAEAGRADRCSLPCRPAPVPAQVPASHPEAPPPARPPPRAPPVWPLRAPPAADDPPSSRRAAGGGSPTPREDESFTGGWAPRRRCRCSGSPARSARAPERCPDLRRSPPSWLEAEKPARRGAARTAGASRLWREREGAGKGAGRAGWGGQRRGARVAWEAARGPATRCRVSTPGGRPRYCRGRRGVETHHLRLSLGTCP